MLTVTSERIEVTGIVQGVGFRPFVHRLATSLNLDGLVGNDSAKVFIEISGPNDSIERFVEQLRTKAPPLAQIEQLTRRVTDSVSASGFRIVESEMTGGARTLISPDTALCDDCINELFDPRDRRFGHPFITCTNCGPRFTIIRSVPYDRPNTTMADFAMCAACELEYRDPANRRYHAQPIACHECGPALSFKDSSDDPVAATVEALAGGAVVAIKGLGGYHLVCDATNDAAIAELRRRKHRSDKPLAVMVADLDHAKELADVDDREAALLGSPAAPIVLLRARIDTALSTLVAPGNPLIGIMLAYTPVHHLLFAAQRSPLVMTSANHRGEPIAYSDEVIASLAGLYDAVLDHDRPIQVPCDDSVVRLVGDRLLPIRRARGYAPIPVRFPSARRSVLAVGGELKNTFCVTSHDHAWVGQHIGDMENLETLRAFEATVAQFCEMYGLQPTAVVADAHPAYMSSKWAYANYPDRVVEVQHHHAHVASIMAEHQLDPAEPVLGFAFDGTGFGDDGTIWGGEVLLANASGYDRVAHLAAIALPGGDAAIRNPCRVALAHLHAAEIAWSPSQSPCAALTGIERKLLHQQLEKGIACVPTTSMGRLFDAIASLIGLRHKISYEAQAAIKLEITAERCTSRDNGYRFEIAAGVIDPSEVLKELLDDAAAGLSSEVLAWRFHDAVAELVERVAIAQRAATGIETVALSGGVFQNALLTRLCIERLEAATFTVLTHSLVPPNDGGLALGQAYIAAHQDIDPSNAEQES
ncbi:MAG: carbamoyltransferase HypF [Acidimicrobiales bacterium]